MVNPAASKFCDGCGISLTQRLQVPTHAIAPPSSTPPSATPPAHGAALGATTSGSNQGAVAGSIKTGLPLAPGMALGDAGRYVIDKPLGKGGMGSIFLAHDKHVNDKPVVIKQLLPNYSTEDERVAAEAAFLEEMKTLASMSHPNIPNISDYFTERNYHFIVQEFIDGEDLQKKIDQAQGKGLPEKQVLGWASQVLSVLAYLEGLDPQVIHRDIKPANILVEPNNRVRVVDFGVASHKFRVGKSVQGSATTSTAMGTPGYAPREQFLGNETTLSDLYALGATMHQLLTGRNPQGIEPLFTYPPIKQLSPNVSEAAIRIVEKALQNDPKHRYQSAAEMKARVDDLLATKGIFSSTRSKLIAVVAALLILAAVGGGAAVYEQQQASLPPTGAVSMGRVAFDTDTTGRLPTAASNNIGSASDAKAWAKAKQDASVQWKNGNISRAQVLYQQASTNDQTDAESQIYSENASILLANEPYYVIAVGSSFSGPKITTGRYALQGAYTAQHEINVAGGINGRKLVLELANNASGASGAVEAAKAAGIPWRLDEYNTCTGGGKTGVSDTFASALWGVDFLFDVAEHGGAGVNLHGGFTPGNYSPICYRKKEDRYEASPLYYGMLLFHQAARGHVVRVECQASANFTAHAAIGDDHKLRVVLINKDLTRPVVASIAPGPTRSTAQLIRLSAPCVSSTEGVTLARSAVARDGSWTPQPGEGARCANGKFEVPVPAASAALLTIE